MDNLTYIRKYYLENKHRFHESASKYMLKQRIIKRLSQLNVVLSDKELSNLIYYRQLHPYCNIKEYVKLRGLV